MCSLHSRKTVLEVFGISPEELAKISGYTLETQKEGGQSLRIFKNPCNPPTNLSYPIKGMIIDDKDQIIAPGVPVPLDLEELDNKARFQMVDDMSGDPSVDITDAVDGIIVRMYHHPNGTIGVSSNGMIVPVKSWGPPGTPSILTLFIQLCESSQQFDETRLNPDYCYYMRMAHQSVPGLTFPTQNRLILTDVIDCRTLARVPINTEEFNHFAHRVGCSFPSVYSITDFLFGDEQMHPSPVNPNRFGVMFRLPDGTVYRVVNWNCKDAEDIQPNHPDPYYHWIHLVQDHRKVITCMDQAVPVELDDALTLLEEKATKYLKYFPHRKSYFTCARECFKTLVTNIAHDLETGRVGPGRLNYLDKLKKESGVEWTPAKIAFHLANEDLPRLIFLMHTH